MAVEVVLTLVEAVVQVITLHSIPLVIAEQVQMPMSLSHQCTIMNIGLIIRVNNRL